MRGTIFKLLLLFLSVGIAPLCHAITCSCAPPLDMGTFARLDTQSGTYVVDEYGIVTHSSNLKTITSPTAGLYRCTETLNGNNGYYWATDPVCSQAITPSGCAATITIKFVDASGVGGTANWALTNGQTRDELYGITLVIPQNCPPGKYTSSCAPNLYGVNGKPPNNATVNPMTFTFTVVPYLTITEISQLHFGVIASQPASTCQVVVAHTGARSGTAFLMPRAPHATAAEFQITGTPNTSFSVSLPSSVSLKDNSGGSGGVTLTVGTFTSSTGAFSGLSTNSSGTATLQFGGTLSVPAGAPSGTYTGDYTVTVNY